MNFEKIAFATPALHLSSFPSRRFDFGTKCISKSALQKPSRSRVRALLGDARIPNDIKELDNIEWERRKEKRIEVEPLTPEEEEALFNEVPSLRELSGKLETAMATSDLDPGDWRVYSWVYLRLRPWNPSRLLQLLGAVGLYFALRATARSIRASFTNAQLVTIFLNAELGLLAVVAFAIPLMLVLYVKLRHHGEAHSDGISRMLIMYNLSTLLLLPTAAIAGTGNAILAMATGIFTRLCMQLPALWFWLDISNEVTLVRRPFGYIVRFWRKVLTYGLLLPGIVFRVLALGNVAPAAGPILQRATALRVRIASTFPVAMSLFADPRGLFLAACISSAVAAVHLLYLTAFVTPLLRKNLHRKCDSWLTRVFVHWKIYMPNVHPDEARLTRTAPPGVNEYTPASAMMLRHQGSVFDLDSSFLSNDAIMPIFSYLDKEDEILKEEGATEWTKPRWESIPLGENMNEQQRAEAVLRGWARPMDPDEAETSFADFFQTLSDDEYQYDATSGEWVFDEGKLAKSAEDIQVVDGNGLDTESMEYIGPPADDAIAVAVPPEMEPWLKKFVEEEGTPTPDAEWLDKFTNDEDDDGRDDPPGTVYV